MFSIEGKSRACSEYLEIGRSFRMALRNIQTIIFVEWIVPQQSSFMDVLRLLTLLYESWPNPVLGAATMIRGSLSRKNFEKSSKAAWNFSCFWLFQEMVPKPC